MTLFSSSFSSISAATCSFLARAVSPAEAHSKSACRGAAGGDIAAVADSRCACCVLEAQLLCGTEANDKRQRHHKPRWSLCLCVCSTLSVCVCLCLVSISVCLRLVVGCWLLVVGCWLLEKRCWLLVVGCCWLRCWLLCVACGCLLVVLVGCGWLWLAMVCCGIGTRCC